MDYIVVEEAAAVGKDLHCEDLHNLWSHNDLPVDVHYSLLPVVCCNFRSAAVEEIAEVPWQ